jgi:transposase
MGKYEGEGVPAVCGPQWREGERSEPDRNGGPQTAARVAPDGSGSRDGYPDPEFRARAQRRKFSAKYKLRILQETEACSQPGQIGALLRREGLYSSHLVAWRRQREKGELEALEHKKRGRKASDRNHPLAMENRQLRCEKQQLMRRLRQAEAIIEVQKKISEILGIPLKAAESAEED